MISIQNAHQTLSKYMLADGFDMVFDPIKMQEIPLNGRQFVQFRITFFLRSGMGPFDAGPYLDRWDFFVQYNQ